MSELTTLPPPKPPYFTMIRREYQSLMNRFFLTYFSATVKIWKQDEDATPDTHPLNWKPTLGRQKF